MSSRIAHRRHTVRPTRRTSARTGVASARLISPGRAPPAGICSVPPAVGKIGLAKSVHIMNKYIVQPMNVNMVCTMPAWQELYQPKSALDESAIVNHEIPEPRVLFGGRYDRYL